MIRTIKDEKPAFILKLTIMFFLSSCFYIVHQSKDRVITTINILFKYSLSIQKTQVSKIKNKCNIDRPKK